MRKLFAIAVLLGLCLLGGPAAAQAPEPGALQPVFACTDLQDSAARLACFDQAVATLRGADSRGEISVLGLNDLRKLDEEAFGFAVPSLERLTAKPAARPQALNEAKVQAEAVKRISASLESLRVGADGKARFRLANGQIWHQIDGGRVLAKPGAEVSIKRAALGSFLLSVAGRSYRVRREQ